MQQNYIEDAIENEEYNTPYESTGALKGVVLSLIITGLMYIVSLFVN